jgi:hypothetical protein
MAMKIRSGFPLRRCSWVYDPIVSVAQTHRMLRWLDVVCVKHPTFRTRAGAASGSKNGAQGVANGM